MIEGDAAQGDTFKDRIGQIRGVDHEVAEAGRSIGSNDEAVGEALTIDDVDAGEDGVQVSERVCAGRAGREVEAVCQEVISNILKVPH